LRVQKSSQQSGGILYLVATPIGNLQDCSPRAQEVLREADVIAAEDTRHTRKLLTYFQITTPMLSYHEHNERKQSEQLLKRLLAGETIALVSDAGLPAVSDPGAEIVARALEQDIAVVPIPGPNAALTALIASGIAVQPHLFLGFLPRVASKRRQELARWVELPVTLICYEAPHRIEKLLTDMHEVLGDREVAVVRELTKKHEEWLRGRISACLSHLQERGARGEYTLIVAGASEQEQSHWWEKLSVIAHVDHYMDNGWSKKEAIREVAVERKLPKREVYQTYHQI
jgi:16S rRNA (cytidine1402-2'-O)-methyltransferase